MISHRVVGCLFLILLSQFGDAYKSHYVETVLESLQRIEDLITKQAEQQTLNCLVPAEKLISLLTEVSKAPNNDSEESQDTRRFLTRLDSDQVQLLRKALGLDDETDEQIEILLKQQRQRNKNKTHNENLNENFNANINQYHSRQTLDQNISNKPHSRNIKANYNSKESSKDVLDINLSNVEN